MKWEDYLQELLKKDTCLNNIKVDIEGQKVDLPNIVKASVFLLEKMAQNQGNRNILVFPDDEQIPFLMMLSKVIYGISSGKVENRYSPETFKPGQILKIGNCVTQFLEIGEHQLMPGKEVIFLKFADADRFGCPLDMAPYFQISDTKKRLSKIASYRKVKKQIDAEAKEGTKALSDLKAIKTHISESVAYVSTVADSERRAGEMQIDGEKLFEYLLVAKADFLGELHYYKGKYVGTPALIFSSQLSYVNEVIAAGTKVQSVIINLNEIDLISQLDELDVLLRKKIPVLCVVDTVNSMELQELINRHFNVWRWDVDSLTNAVCSNSDTISEKKIRKCIESNVEYHRIAAPDISAGFISLYKYNKRIEDESAQMNTIYAKLIHLAYLSVRGICAIDSNERKRFTDLLEECANNLELERSFISPELYKDFEKTIDTYFRVFEKNDVFPKTDEIYKLLLDKRYDKFYIICSNHDNPAEVKRYWENRLAKNGYRPSIYVVYPKEFLGLENVYADVAILAGWFSGNLVKKIVYGYRVRTIHIFTYDCEERWRKAHTKSWKIGLNNETNQAIIKKSFSENIDNITSLMTNHDKLDNEDGESLAQQDDFDLIIQESRYRQYTARGTADGNQIVEAKPIGFVGGDFALFTEGHKVLVATKIILQTSKQIEKKEVEDLKVGDFIVVRESDKDIIRDVADKILEANNKTEYRKTASLWRDALKIEEAFSSLDDIYNRLIAAGCTRNYQTVRNWLQSEDLIIPQDAEDLKYIAEITGDSVLLEKMDEVISAGNYIKNTHIKAGRVLSERLSASIASTLLQEKEIDPYNIWEPIELELDEVGIVKILKIIDIGQEYIPVDFGNANKILAEEKENVLWQE